MPKFLPIPGESDDARAIRTRDAIATALIALMHEQGFDDITVQAICERAGVGRSTFYAHFVDRDDVFIRHNVEFGRVMGSRLEWDEGASCYRFPLAWLLEHVSQMRPLFDSLARARKIEFVLKVWQNNLAEVFGQRILSARAGRASDIPTDVLAQQLAGTIKTLMTWWLDHHQPLSASDMERQFLRLTAGLR